MVFRVILSVQFSNFIFIPHLLLLFLYFIQVKLNLADPNDMRSLVFVHPIKVSCVYSVYICSYNLDINANSDSVHEQNDQVLSYLI